MENDKSSGPIGEETVARLKVILGWLITIAGVLVGAAIGLGVSLLIGFLIELITQPAYPDLMMAYWFVPVICISLFTVVFGILSHRLGSQIQQTRCKHSNSGDAFDDNKK